MVLVILHQFGSKSTPFFFKKYKVQGNLGTVILVIAAALPNRHCCKVLRGTMQTYRQIITCTLLFTRTKIDNEVELPSDIIYDVYFSQAISLAKIFKLPYILTRLYLC